LLSLEPGVIGFDIQRTSVKQIVNMNTLTHNGFQFKEDFDGQFLADMYEDLNQLDETFTVIIAQLKEELLAADKQSEAGDKESIRKIFHKIKPLWGYVGLNKMQNETQLFETYCTQKETFENIKSEYFNIRKKSDDALQCLLKNWIE
jgi:HPt (histidine-containing phosphotransfer) domain-containing protein